MIRTPHLDDIDPDAPTAISAHVALARGRMCKFAGNSDPLRGIIASNSDPF